MGWKISIDGQGLLVDDLPVEAVAKIADRHGVSWYELSTSSPARSPAAFFDLVRLVAERIGVPPPEHDGSVRSMRALVRDLIENVPDDLPAEWVDGNPPVGDPTTRSSSGSPDVTDGPQT